MSAAFERFFVACDIPATMVPKYASRFVKERIHPALIKDLGKDDLRELGVTALGDQLAIMRYIKQCEGNPPEFNSVEQSKRKSESRGRETADFESDEDEPMLVDSNSSSSFKAPDREDIYHIKMPIGTLPKTRKILEKNRSLRDRGVLKRGVSGVRRSGIELNKPLNAISTRSKVIGRKAITLQDTDITSSTAFVPLGSMRSDSISTKTTVVADNTGNSRPSAGVSLANRFASLSGDAPNIRFQLGKVVSPSVQFPSRRPLVRYSSDINDFSTTAEPFSELPTEMVRKVRKNNSVAFEPPAFRAPIAERIQIVGQSRRSRPVISTTRGMKMVAAGGNSGRLEQPTLGKRTSILDRITMTK
ncbi:hypothetical protein niasHT_028072 [Heterodera trifolii]|uniref:SAM domain-containing protein n=1 Tax=Heterodera trifolii TaxID=157864 RepID=A0ABD2KEK2_9BILA